MRRRETFAEATRKSDPVGYRTAHDPLSVFDAARPTESGPVVPKGTCPKCLKHIGKGIAFHVRACNVE